MTKQAHILRRSNPPPWLFLSGGCHIFAVELKRLFPEYELIEVTTKTGSSLHIACRQKPGMVVDACGWYTEAEYIKSDFRETEHLRFNPVSENEIECRSSDQKVDGRFYIHFDFLGPAREIANEWILAKLPYFNGERKMQIPEICRVRKASAVNLFT